MSIATVDGSAADDPGPGVPAAWDPYLASTPDSGAAMEPTATALGLLDEPATVLVEQLFTALAARLRPGGVAGRFTVDWDFIDLGGWHRMVLAGGELLHWPIAAARPGADVAVTITRPQLYGVVAGAGLDGLPAAGDAGAQRRLIEALSPVRTPRAIDDPLTEPLADPIDPRAGQRRRDRSAEPAHV